MRVLMLNRNDVHEVLGGDTIQMLQTKANLENLGVEIELDTLQNAPSFDGFDLIHVFNWSQLEPILVSTKWNPALNPPIVLSPIFWFHTGHWFDQAASTTPVWKFMVKGLDSRRSRRIYEAWQQLKFRWGTEGRSLHKYLKYPLRLLPNSNTEINHLESTLGVIGRLRDRCSVVPNGIVRSNFDPRPKPSQAFVDQYGVIDFVIQVARIQKAKNQLALIEALFDTSIPLVFVGQPSPYEPDYVNLCYERGRQRGNVFFTGPLPPEDLPGIYALAAVHALPSWRETPGLASLEAAAAGCKIVSTSIGCTREYFGDDAWYCDPGNLKSIRQAVLSALDASPSDRLRNLVLERYTWEAAARKTLDAYYMAKEYRKSKDNI